MRFIKNTKQYCAVSVASVLSLLFLISCNSQKSADEKLVFISEPFLNRVIENVEDHDANCIGFIHNQFAPATINADLLSMDSVPSLNDRTGLKWIRYATTDSIVNFLHIFSSDDDTNRVAFLAEVITADSDEERIFSLGSDDGFKLWINGESIAGSHKGRQLLPHDDIVKVKLKEGRNVFLYKIDQGTGDWAIFRKFITAEQLSGIIADHVPELYDDIPESCILPDSATGIFVNERNGRNLDLLHSIQFQWKDIDNLRVLGSSDYAPPALPAFVRLPDRFNGMVLFEVVVTDKNDNVVFRESVPIFTESKAMQLLRNAQNEKRSVKEPIYTARREAVLALFVAKSAVQYSSRLKAHTLYDFYQQGERSLSDNFYYQVPQVWGYRSKADASIQPFRVFMPDRLSQKTGQQSQSYPLIFLMRWVAEKEIDNNYWTSQQFQSHWRTVKRAAHSTVFQAVLTMPFGRGFENYSGKATEEFLLVFKEIDERLPIDHDRIGLFAHSNAPAMALDLLQSQKLPITHLGLWSPILTHDETAAYAMLLRIKQNCPDLKWYIWQGAEDERAPAQVTRKWIQLIRKIPFEVHYYEELHSTHFVYLGDPEKEFMRILQEATLMAKKDNSTKEEPAL